MTLRPALIARFPEVVRNGLRPYGIHVRTLLLQGGDDTLPATEPPLIVDLRGQTPIEAARLLVALQMRQRRSGLIPHLLAPRDKPIYQRLIAGLPMLRAAVIAGDDLSTLATWLWAPLDLSPEQLWVNLCQPAPLTAQQHLTSFIAALDGAETVTDAAQRCAISRRTTYALLRTWTKTRPARQSATEWKQVLERLL